MEKRRSDTDLNEKCFVPFDLMRKLVAYTISFKVDSLFQSTKDLLL